MTVQTLLATLALTLWPIPWMHGASGAQTSHVGGWTLRVHIDPFSQHRTCRLSRPRVDYLRQALVFHLAARTDTSDALYRIDGGPPVSAGADDMELAGLGFALHNDDLSNPSGGLVRIPLHRVLAASVVSIEAQANHRPAKFKIGGLSAALDAAQKAGCGSTDFQ